MEESDPAFAEVLAASTLLHSKTPNVSFDTYRDTRYKLFSRFVTKRHLVYLDMNFWIGLATPPSDEYRRLLASLRQSVESGLLLCPISFTHFTELKKQNQTDGRQMRVARLMDELSLGVSLRNVNDLERIEFLTFFAKQVPRLGQYIDSVWCPTGHLLSEHYPYDDALPDDFMEFGRKVMCDVHWHMSVEYLATRVGLPEFHRQAAKLINQDRQVYKRGKKSFRHLLEDELVGILEVVRIHIDEIVLKMREARFSSEEVTYMEGQRDTALTDIVLEALNPKTPTVPSQRIHAALHAQRRMDDMQQFTENDLDDFRHGATAAAYCDMLFCERNLAHLLRTQTVSTYRPRLKVIATDPKSARDAILALGNPA